ncbi:MAG: hypothetical protein LW838_12235 [Nitrosomonadaceae bacterium]|jgi:hypothetical protein|nr:hypothetical protein [Nitrosomonadaceae bacterium]
MNTQRIDTRFHVATAGLFMVLVSSVALSTTTELEAQTLTTPAALVTQSSLTQSTAPASAVIQPATATRVEQIVVTAKRI